MKKLLREFYNRDTVLVAMDLLGKLLVHRVNGVNRIGKIVETEAYLGEHDPASHSAPSRTPNRAEVMFGPPGYAYVYKLHRWDCMNAVTEPKGNAAAVLLRAIEPIQNLTEPTKGPGLLSRAMGINRKLNGHDLESDNLFIADPEAGEYFPISERPRHGLGKSCPDEWKEQLLRFYIKGNKHVSKR